MATPESHAINTARLYGHHSSPLPWEAGVIALATWRGKSSTWLNRSTLYPEAGGQMPDCGTLANPRRPGCSGR